MFSTIDVKSKIQNYSILFIDNIDEINKLINQENVITVIDKTVKNLFFTSICVEKTIELESNEQIKTLESSAKILKKFSDLNLNSKSIILVIGGGILQDLIGFCASIYNRGLDYILIPTTLLAQTDSCIGGKTSINFNNKKNILGTFYPPCKIIIYTKFLKTLNKMDLFSGAGEIFKFYILQSKIKQFPSDISKLEILEKNIFEGLKYKNSVLEKDEFDKKERKFLNFGHTFAHALESTSNYKMPHGIAVIIGCMIAIEISKKVFNNVLDYEDIIKTGNRLIKESVNFEIEKIWFDFDVLLPIIKADKKNTDCINMVLIDIDKPVLYKIIELENLKTAVNKIYEGIRLYNSISS
jgi:3-dehydroquinate synthase